LVYASVDVKTIEPQAFLRACGFFYAFQSVCCTKVRTFALHLLLSTGGSFLVSTGGMWYNGENVSQNRSYEIERMDRKQT